MWVKNVLLFCLVLLTTNTSIAQMTADPTSWTYEVKKTGADRYNLIFHLKLKEGWHIWSIHPGGDGYEIAPSFTFDKNAQVTLESSITEKGSPITTEMPGVTGKVTYLSKEIRYTQTIKAKGKTTVTGEHEYQVCNDNLCLPPKTKKFSFTIK